MLFRTAKTDGRCGRIIYSGSTCYGLSLQVNCCRFVVTCPCVPRTTVVAIAHMKGLAMDQRRKTNAVDNVRTATELL